MPNNGNNILKKPYSVTRISVFVLTIRRNTVSSVRVKSVSIYAGNNVIIISNRHITPPPPPSSSRS
jgi:hypothetical protein